MTDCSKLQVAMLQMVSTAVPEFNLERARILLQDAAEQGVALAVLPENFACFGLESFDRQQRFDIGARATELLSACAAEFGLWVIGGSVPGANQDGVLCAQSPVFGPDGKLHARYEKLHLFDVDVGDAHGAYRESATYAYGTQVVCTDVGGCKTGLSICYDLRFPELYRLLARQGAELMVVPSAFTYRTGKAHWEALLRARAIENLCWVVAPNQGGQHDAKRRTWGHSMIIDPWGRVVAQAADGECVCCHELDLELVRKLRADMPVLEHSRLQITPP